MHKKTGSPLQRLPSWFSHGIFQGLVIVLVVSGAMAVYAAVISWPNEPYTPTGLEPVFVGTTPTNAFTGVLTYVTATAKCSTAFAGSHVCNADEIIHSYNLSVPAVLSQTGAAWFNNGPPGYSEVLINDCSGWASKAATNWGSYWSFDNDKALVKNCDATTLPFACCK